MDFFSTIWYSYGNHTVEFAEGPVRKRCEQVSVVLWNEGTIHVLSWPLLTLGSMSKSAQKSYLSKDPLSLMFKWRCL